MSQIIQRSTHKEILHEEVSTVMGSKLACFMPTAHYTTRRDTTRRDNFRQENRVMSMTRRDTTRQKSGLVVSGLTMLDICDKVIFSRQASLARQAFLITPLHGARYKTGKTLTPKSSAM